eukprot:GHVP01031488.1.p1 GENE.GHVP01031488.1~~GHVP01031488.1.p1  ORF type:complete len:939 (+),score=174.17 GHVP01031488.1:38-2854(+)
MAVQAKQGQEALATRDQNSFRNMIALNDRKQFKKALKTSDALLKKYPNHGEILAIRALILSGIPERKHESYVVAKTALRKDMSSICWHVLGLLHRSDKNYFEAAKCYKMAFAVNSHSLQILRDLATLQLQTRLFESFLETRRKAFTERIGVKFHWSALALAFHLTQNRLKAVEVLDEMWSSLVLPELNDVQTPEERYENSEIILYQAMLYEEIGMYQEGIDFLRSRKTFILDEISEKEFLGRFFTFLGRHEEAFEIYRELLHKRPEHESYVMGQLKNKKEFLTLWPSFLCQKSIYNSQIKTSDFTDEIRQGLLIWTTSHHCLARSSSSWDRSPFHCYPAKYVHLADGTGKLRKLVLTVNKRKRFLRRPLQALALWCDNMDDNIRQSIVEFLREMKLDSKSRLACEKLILPICPISDFSSILKSFLTKKLRKGVFAVFDFVRPLYTSKRVLIINQTLHKMVEDAEKNSKIVSCDEESDGSAPFAYPILIALLAQHYELFGFRKQALVLLDKAIEHTPTMLEIYVLRAKIEKRTGLFKKAAETMEIARQLDLADRSVNVYRAKYLMKINEIETAEEISSCFSRQSIVEGLSEIQNVWYDQELASAHVRRGQYFDAAERLNKIQTYYEDISHDQFDFHNYCLRKMTYRTYITFLRSEEAVFSHKGYLRAARELTNLYKRICSGEIQTDVVKSQKSQGALPKNTKKPKEEKKTLGEIMTLNLMKDVCYNLRSRGFLSPDAQSIAYEILRCTTKNFLVMAHCLQRMFDLAEKNQFDILLSPLLVDFLATFSSKQEIDAVEVGIVEKSLRQILQKSVAEDTNGSLQWKESAINYCKATLNAFSQSPDLKYLIAASECFLNSSDPDDEMKKMMTRHWEMATDLLSVSSDIDIKNSSDSELLDFLDNKLLTSDIRECGLKARLVEAKIPSAAEFLKKAHALFPECL